ncbi:MAG: helix-turn-helix domain-containing protein [Planctomycetes bacterium]|nr:helix-turn-helix domain-containing protein [Planctomycetota bacterium]
MDGAAALLGVSIKTFSKVLREGDVPGRKVGREWKFSRRALIDWIGQSRSRNFLDQTDAGLGERPRRARAAAAVRRRKTDDGYSADDMR